MGIGSKVYYCRSEGRTYCFERTKYTDFVEAMGLQKGLLDSGYSSPKTYVRERHMRDWTAYQVVKRMETAHQVTKRMEG